MSNDPRGRDDIHYHLLGSSNKPLVLCDSEEDEKFLKTLGPFFGTSMENFIVKSGDGQVDHFKLVIDSNRDVIMVVGKDFRLAARNKESEGLLFEKISLICWDLPSIESYLFIHFIKRGHYSLRFMQDNSSLNLLANKFMEGWLTKKYKLVKQTNELRSEETNELKITSNDSNEGLKEMATNDYVTMFNQWNSAVAAAMDIMEVQYQAFLAYEAYHNAKISRSKLLEEAISSEKDIATEETSKG